MAGFLKHRSIVVASLILKLVRVDPWQILGCDFVTERIQHTGQLS